VLSEQFLLALPKRSSARLSVCVRKTRAFVTPCLIEAQAAGQVRSDQPAEALAPIVMGTIQMLTLRIARAGIEKRLDDGSALALLSEDLQEKERLKLQGSPTYVFDHGRAMLYGNFPYGELHATVEELLRGLGPEGSAC
jgi:hypothetical protein